MPIRHSLAVRFWHWINACAFLALVVSGAMILCVLPELYWGEDGYYGYGHPAVVSFPLEPNQEYSAPGRNTHFLAAWIFVLNGAFYLGYGFVSGHFLNRLVRASHYVPLQKVSYSTVIFLLFPAMLLTGLTMSPGVLAACPWLLDLWGGRQSARTIHFFCACALVLFLVAHLIQSYRRGFGRLARAMLTGSNPV